LQCILWRIPCCSCVDEHLAHGASDLDVVNWKLKDNGFGALVLSPPDNSLVEWSSSSVSSASSSPASSDPLPVSVAIGCRRFVVALVFLFFQVLDMVLWVLSPGEEQAHGVVLAADGDVPLRILIR